MSSTTTNLASCDRSHAPAWERAVWPLQRLVRTAGAVLAAFPRWGVGTITSTKKSSVVQTEGKSEVSDHFRGVTKMVVCGNVAAVRQFSTQCGENLSEVPA